MSLASASLTFGALRTDVIPGAFCCFSFLLLLLFQLLFLNMSWLAWLGVGVFQL